MDEFRPLSQQASPASRKAGLSSSGIHRLADRLERHFDANWTASDPGLWKSAVYERQDRYSARFIVRGRSSNEQCNWIYRQCFAEKAK